MFEELRRLQVEIESLMESVDEKFGLIRTDMARQAAAFDQSMAALQQDFRRGARNQSIIWGALLEHAAHTQDDVAGLKRRVEDIERRMAG